MADDGVTVDGGYDAEFCSPVPPDFLCAICHLAFRSPVQLPCGHQFCKSCWQKTIKSAKTCPVDRQNIELKKVFPDLAVERKILSLLVKCNNDGCSWSEELRALKVHLDTNCPFQKVACKNELCGTEVQRSLMENHILECMFELGHLLSCKEAPLECTSGCGAKDIPRKKLEDHLTKDCPMAMLQCCYANVGCAFEGNKLMREKHEDDSVKEHLLLSTKFIRSLDEKCNVGSMLWIVEGYKAKAKHAEEFGTTSKYYYSSPFLSSKGGYKLRISMKFTISYLFPANNSISVGLQLMKGSCDPILAWPFYCTYEVTLLGKAGKRKTFKNFEATPSNAANTNYMRPTNDVNLHRMRKLHIKTKLIEEEGFLIDDSVYLRYTILTDKLDGGSATHPSKKRKL